MGQGFLLHQPQVQLSNDLGAKKAGVWSRLYPIWEKLQQSREGFAAIFTLLFPD